MWLTLSVPRWVGEAGPSGRYYMVVFEWSDDDRLRPGFALPPGMGAELT
jgi:hypothetical protein